MSCFLPTYKKYHTPEGRSVEY